MVDSVTEARKRQMARLDGVKPPMPRKAMTLAKSKAYQDGADAEATLRAYATDVANFEAWCAKHGFTAMPATPEVVGAYLAAAGEGYAMPTLRRRVAAIARACGVAGHPLDTKHPAIRETLRGIGRKHGTPARRAAALTTTEVRKLCRACGTGVAGARDRALFLLGFAGAMRRSELVGLDVAHVTWTDDGLKLLIERSKTDKQGEGAEIAIPRGRAEETCPVAALKRLRMLMPLLVRLIDSEIEVIDGVVPQISDRIEDGFRVPEEISPCWLSIDEKALLPDLHVNPIHWDV